MSMPSKFRLLSDWIESNGGPLVLTSTQNAKAWRGGFWEDESSHYRAACNVKGWTGLILIEGHQFAVLNDLPLPTIAANVDDSTLLIRWLYAESDEELLGAAADWVSRFDSKSVPACEIELACRPGSLVIFDSAYDGTADHGGATFEIEYPAESIRTYMVEADEQTAFLVDRLV
ncbi:hypothetical protein Spa11_16390 [Botrimarina mediterranea]|uniref:Immunity protein 21 n=2 Tax=Botrimarina mediterranea TaxID=2528022 RepID=A0A518K6L6_9BACT|nr:hypothetical protein Spa11_16390 [Botrimarina mediterranea]